MWTVVYITAVREQAENLKSVLEAADIIVMLREVTDENGVENGTFEILVPETEIGQAHEIIIEKE